MKHTLLSCCLLALACGCSSDPETLVKGGYDQAEMDKAIQRAVSEVDNFIAKLQSGEQQGYAVKVPIEDGESTEHFWLTGVSFADGKFSGTINNEPGIVSNVKIGQPWTVARTDISDWMYMQNGKIHGNYTMRPLLDTMPKEEADAIREMLANP